MRRKVYEGGLYRFVPAGRDISGQPVYAVYCMGRFEGYRYRLLDGGLVVWVPCPGWRVAGKGKVRRKGWGKIPAPNPLKGGREEGRMRGMLDRLLQAALDGLETDNWPEAAAQRSAADVEATIEACVAGLGTRGCPVEISARPSWEGEAGDDRVWPCGLYDGDARRVWVYGGLDPEDLLLVLLHEAAHALDPGREGREFAACLAAAAACLRLGILDEPTAVRYLADELGAAARMESGRRVGPEEVCRSAKPLLGSALLGRAARVAEELVALIRDGQQLQKEPESLEGRG